MSEPKSRVLLVDPDADALASLAAALRERGVRVSLANGASMACERAKSGAFDVLLAASVLAAPDADGLGLLDTLAIELGRPIPHLYLVDDASLSDTGLSRSDVDGIVARVVALTEPRPATSSEPPAVDRASSAPMSFTLARTPLSDLIRTFAAERRSGTLSVNTARGAGELRLLDGDVIDAVYLRLEGPKAVARMLGEHEGAITFMPGSPAVMRRIRAGAVALLDDSLKQVEAARAARLALGDLATHTICAIEGSQSSDLSGPARAALARLRVPATLDDVLDDSPGPDTEVLDAIRELDLAGRIKRLEQGADRVQLCGPDQLHLLRAVASRARAPGFTGAARVVFAGTPGRLAVFSHTAMSLADAVPAAEPPPLVPIPHAIATLRLGDGVELDLVALPLVPAYAPLWLMALSGSAVVVRLDEAAANALADACTSAEIPVVDAQMLVGSSMDETSSREVAGLIRAALESATPS